MDDVDDVDDAGAIERLLGGVVENADSRDFSTKCTTAGDSLSVTMRY